MTLTKREKKLLHIFATFLLFGIILSFLYLPEKQRQLELKEEMNRLETENEKVQSLLADTLLEGRLEREQMLAEKNYDYFYSQLNSYTIDTIVNNLLQKNDLYVSTLQISPYEDAVYDFPLAAEEGTEEDGGQAAEESVLVKSTINVSVAGKYENMLQFMADLNDKSTCLRIDLVSVEENNLIAEETGSATGIFRIYIYGVKVRPISIEVNTEPESTEAAAP